MTKVTKPVCVGRYLVDVPAAAEVELSGGMMDGFDVDTIDETEAEFRERIDARQAEIEASQADAASGTEGGMVEVRNLDIPGMVGRTFIHGRSRGYLIEGDRQVWLESVSVEIHAHIDGVSISLSARSTDEASARQAEAFLARLRLRGDDEVPSLPGFCIRRAVFAEPLPAHRSEYLVMRLALPGHADLGLTLFSVGGAAPGPGLLERVAQTKKSMGADTLLRMITLRSGKRSINGVDGEEVLVRAREYNFTTTYGFNWEAPGTKDDPMRPFLSLELRSGMSARSGGKPIDASLHEDALLAIWDHIAASIRVRKAVGRPPPGLRRTASTREIPQPGAY